MCIRDSTHTTLQLDFTGIAEKHVEGSVMAYTFSALRNNILWYWFLLKCILFSKYIVFHSNISRVYSPFHYSLWVLKHAKNVKFWNWKRLVVDRWMVAGTEGGQFLSSCCSIWGRRISMFLTLLFAQGHKWIEGDD